MLTEVVYIAPVNIFIVNRKCQKCQGSGKVEEVNVPMLRKAREKRGMSLRAMAEKIGVSAPYISDVELGRRACPRYVLEAYQSL